ncbi:type VII toxin-antitoxin system MntA family adenylyltransferase antitoxin [Atrimonas thermophila]|uniref:type VII toxin-antitoxin system MntA family adenylyltransferase antitoxin n=1 Tax=Atrimonas thermophila TaxID=3064161 RepID=UPI00399CF473
MSLEGLTEIARKKLVEYLESVDFVDFAILFGSLAHGKPHPGSDCDLGIATTRKVSLLEAGFLVARLEEIVGKEVDLVIVNDLPFRNPVLAFEVARGKLLFARDSARFVAFKEKAFLHFLDTQFLRNLLNQALLKRIEEGRFGKRSTS